MVCNWGSMKGRLLACASTMLLGGAMAGAATAAEFEWGDVTVDIDSTVNIGVGIRTVNPDARYIAASNGGTNRSVAAENVDDGNQNFLRGDIYSASTRAIHDVEISLGNVGAFTRFSYFYDAVKNDADSTRRTDLSDAARRRAGRGIDVLDAYVYGDFEMMDMPLAVRLGNQAINWGEALYRSGGIAQTNAIDVIKLETPGAEVREAFLPSPMAWASIAITPELSLEGYYQFQWRQSRLVPVGTFLSGEDLFGPGAEGFFLAGDPGGTGLPASALLAAPTGVRKAGDERPNDQGQWGVAARYYAEGISSEFGLYYLNYHAKTPYVGASASRVVLVPAFPPFIPFPITADLTDNYFASFPEDIDLYGATATFPLGDISIGVEASYQPDYPVPIDGLSAATTAVGLAGGGAARSYGFARMDRLSTIANAHVSIGPGMPVFGAITEAMGADAIDIVGEAGLVDFQGALPTGASGDNFSWGYNLTASAPFSRAFGTDITLTPSVDFRHDVNGLSIDRAVTSNYVENRRGITLGLEASYEADLAAKIAYTNNMGGGTNSAKSDRDYVTFTVSYAF